MREQYFTQVCEYARTRICYSFYYRRHFSSRKWFHTICLIRNYEENIANNTKYSPTISSLHIFVDIIDAEYTAFNYDLSDCKLLFNALQDCNILHFVLRYPCTIRLYGEKLRDRNRQAVQVFQLQNSCQIIKF